MGIVSALLHQQQIQSFEDAFGVKDVTTQEMQQAIQTWFALYFDGDAPPEEDDCQRIPAIIVNKLYKTAFSEYSAGIVRDGADWLYGELERLNRKAKTAVQYQLVGGECLIKPVLWGGALDFTLIRRDCFLPLARDADGKLLSVGTVEITAQGGWYYSLLERRTVEADGALTIESRLFRSRDGASLGAEVPLDALDKYAGLSPALRLPGIGGVGLVQLRTPLFNCVDGTADAVSVYAPAVGLIKNINRNERQLCQEFENGASRIIASGDLLKTDKYGNKRLSDGLFVGIDEDPEAVGITIFNPTLRESSYLARKQEYLRDCDILGVSQPQYTPAELEAMRQQNAKGVTIEGRHYSMYEATQMQRKMERSIRKQKKRILVDKATGDEEKLQIDQTKLRMQNANYKKFSDAAGLRTQRERVQVAGFGRKEAAEAQKAVAKYSKVRYNKDGTVVVTDDWTGKSHPHLSPTYTPNAVVDTLSQNGRQHDRSFYDANGRQVKQISNGPHGNPKRHPYGQQGEHAHDIIWEDGKIVDRPVREITEQERKENADIL